MGIATNPEPGIERTTTQLQILVQKKIIIIFYNIAVVISKSWGFL